MLTQQLEKLGLKEDEISTFIYLLENPGKPVGIIAKKIGLSRPSLYFYLNNLEKIGLIIETQRSGVKVFFPSPIDKINILLDKKIKDLNETKDAIGEAFILAEQGKVSTTPKVLLFEGKEELRHLANELLLYRNITTKSSWPIKKMLETLGADFFKEFNKERIKRGVFVQALWPEKKVVDMNKYPFMGAGKYFLRDIRIAPKNVDFSTGYWIIENKVAFVSSNKENFGFLIESAEFADLMRSHFDFIWKSSKELRVSEKESERLYEEMMEG